MLKYLQVCAAAFCAVYGVGLLHVPGVRIHGVLILLVGAGNYIFAERRFRREDRERKA